MGRGGENFYSMRWMKLICHSVIMSHSFSFLWVRNKNMSPRSCQSADHRHYLPQRTPLNLRIIAALVAETDFSSYVTGLRRSKEETLPAHTWLP